MDIQKLKKAIVKDTVLNTYKFKRLSLTLCTFFLSFFFFFLPQWNKTPASYTVFYSEVEMSSFSCLVSNLKLILNYSLFHSWHPICQQILLLLHRGRFTLSLMKFKLSGLLLSWTPFQILGGSLAKCSHGHMFSRNLHRSFFRLKN